MNFDKVLNPLFLKISDGQKTILTTGSMRDVCKYFEVDYCPTFRMLRDSLKKHYNLIADNVSLNEFLTLKSKISDSKGKIVLV